MEIDPVMPYTIGVAQDLRVVTRDDDSINRLAIKQLAKLDLQ
jgi:hypothetical protein